MIRKAQIPFLLSKEEHAVSKVSLDLAKLLKTVRMTALDPDSNTCCKWHPVK